MGKRFLYLCFFWNTVTVAQEISRNLLLDHYSLISHSVGIGVRKENQKNKSILGWIHFGNTLSPNLNYNLQISYVNYYKEIHQYLPNSNIYYQVSNESKQILSVNPGLSFKYISFYSNFISKNQPFNGVSVGLNVFPEKSIFLFYRKDSFADTNLYALSVVSGTNPGIGLLVSKEIFPEKVEWSGSVSLSFQMDLYGGGGIYFTNEKKEENSFFISRKMQQKQISLFETEINPLVEERILNSEEIQKELEKKTFNKKEKIIYEVKIEELLKYRIPLVIAIRISRASKSKEEYIALLKTLPPEIVRKCNKIQFDKTRVKP